MWVKRREKEEQDRPERGAVIYRLDDGHDGAHGAMVLSLSLSLSLSPSLSPRVPRLLERTDRGGASARLGGGGASKAHSLGEMATGVARMAWCLLGLDGRYWASSAQSPLFGCFLTNRLF